MAWTSRLSRMSAAPGMARACARDRQGWRHPGAVAVPARLAVHTAGRGARGVPRLSCAEVHPADDRWTSAALSTRFLARVAAPTTLVLLTYAGHLPVEQPGLDQLRDAVRRILDEVACGTTSR